MKNKGKFLITVLLAFGIYVLSNGMWSIPLFAWIYPILFLYLLETFHSPKTCLILYGIYAAGFVIQFRRVIGMGIWWCVAAALLFSTVKIVPYLFRLKWKNTFQATIAFAAAMTVAEYVVAGIYPILGGVSDAYTQYGNLRLLQITTLTGIYGIIFIMNWTASMAVWLWNKRGELVQVRTYISIYGAAMGAVFLYGTVMLQGTPEPSESVRVAAVTEPVSQLLNEDEDVYAVYYTDSFTDLQLINAKRKLAAVTDELFAKTVREAEAGAKIIFWSELNGAVMKEDEAALLERASETAKSEGIYLIVSLLVKTPYEDLKENKTAAFDPDGELLSEYYKHGRSIGELCIKGDGILQSFDTKYGRIAPLICSDLAFTSVVRQVGKNAVDLLIVPASDWKEITEQALKTAVVRGVENGCQVDRHANRGVSAAVDARGNIFAVADYFQSDTKTMTAQTPVGGRFTLYPMIGDAFVYLCGLYLLGTFAWEVKKGKKAYISAP